MTVRTSNSLAELVRAYAALRPRDQGVRARIAAALGIVAAPDEEVVDEEPDAARARTPHEPVREPPLPPERPPVPRASEDEEPGARIRLTPFSTDVGEAPLARWRVVPALDAYDRRRHGHVPLAHEPLLRPRWTRGVLSASVATAAPLGAIDVDRLVDTIARGHPVREIVRRPVPSLFRGVQLLVDVEQGLDPYRRDQRELVDAVRRTAGREGTHVLQFRGNPLDGAGIGSDSDWRAYRPPGYGSPVLVLTDLGLGPSSGRGTRRARAAWLRFARLLRRRMSRLIVFVPYPERRWPRRLACEMTLVEWDRDTSVRTIRRLVRREDGRSR